jgi:tRNA A-37 threonylcarbamoyl transferase component Bud32
MPPDHDAYCFADASFFESPTRVLHGDFDFELARGPVPVGWRRAELEDWLVYRPNDASLPPQGWKIHASSCIEDAERTLATVWDYCVPRQIAFKFIRGKDLLFLRNVKYADRRASGKFVTIYPVDELQLEVILSELGQALEGQRGPYILSDLRWESGPLYVRYGGFVERYCVGPTGALELAIAEPDGRLVPDRRQTTFQVPSWVKLPECLDPQLAARNGTTVGEMPYRIERALHFSNGGGVYVAVDPSDDTQVVLKEARPFAGLAIDGADAVTRLQRERDVLLQLVGLDAVPGVRNHFTIGGHHFLALDYVEGRPLTKHLVERNPMTRQVIEEEAAAEYVSWVLDVYGRLEAAVEAIHDRGVVIGDLHPYNILVRPDGAVALIDFEVAADVAQGRRPTLADPGFAPPRDCTGFDIDRYAMACLRLYMFFPLTKLLAHDRGKAVDMAQEIGRIFPVPSEFLADAVRTITAYQTPAPAESTSLRPRLHTDPHSWRMANESMARAILSTATPDRPDRLFPGDVRQFTTVGGGLNIAHGAAGVLYALDAAGIGRFHDYEDWLANRALRPEQGTRPGLYDGLHGVAHVLDRLGHRAEALEVLAICAAELDGHLDRVGLDLYGGLAGIGLNLMHFAATTGDVAFKDAAWEVASAVADRLGDEDGVPEISGGDHPYAGLTRGSSGPALMFIRLYEQSGDDAFLDLARTALRQDLRRCYRRDDGSLEINEGWRTMPYLADGSIGIGVVLDDYLGHRQDERFTEAAAAIDLAAASQFYVEPGLFYGRAGMILYLSRCNPRGTADRDALIAAQIRRLEWHALTHQGDLAFPGDMLRKLSMDLATGAAGVVLALGAALNDPCCHLPFLERRSSRASRSAGIDHSETKGGELHGCSGPAGLANRVAGGRPPRERGE